MHDTREDIPTQGSDILPIRESIKNSSYIIIGKGLSFLVSLGAITILAKVVPRDTVGIYQYIMATFTLVSITTLPGMNPALTRAIARGHEGSVASIMKKRIEFGLFGSLIAFAIGIYYLLQGNIVLGVSFLVTVPFVSLTDTFSNATFQYWQGKKRFDRSALFYAVYYGGIGLISSIIFIFTKNIFLILAGVLIAQACMGYAVFTSIRAKNTITDPLSEKFGFHLTIMQGVKIITNNADRIIVWHLLGPAMVAIYSFASLPIIKAWQLLPIGVVSLPHLSNHRLTSTTKHMILQKIGLLFLLIIPLVVVGILVAPWLYHFLFPLYPESVIYFQILAIGLIGAPVLLLDAALTAFHKTRLLYISEIASPIVKITLMIIGGIYFDMIGIAAGIALGSILDLVTTLILFITAKTED